ncbi:hypothetical protein AGMMS49928_24360 [Spirochaetia bacterium]|nr:hypothetical protein AGMMS49928_24360 [Spirochaetia bacterium]
MKNALTHATKTITMTTANCRQFNTQKLIVEFDIDFGNINRGVRHYAGYRLGKNDFWRLMNTSYFFDMAGDEEILIIPSFWKTDNNDSLDERIKDAMRTNKLTCCTTFKRNDIGGYCYIVNYSFDNCKTFGFMSVDSLGREA